MESGEKAARRGGEREGQKLIQYPDAHIYNNILTEALYGTFYTGNPTDYTSHQLTVDVYTRVWSVLYMSSMCEHYKFSGQKSQVKYTTLKTTINNFKKLCIVL